jgi:hypothetical protein
MRFKQNGNKRDLMAVVIYNDEATATIPVGAPVVLSLSGTQDGLAVVLPSTAGNAKQSTFGYGVSLNSIPPKGFGEAQVFGLCNNVAIMRTRATSTDPYVTLASGVLLLAESVSNTFVTAASNGASAFVPVAAIASTIASIASTAASTATAFTSQCVAFLRMM